MAEPSSSAVAGAAAGAAAWKAVGGAAGVAAGGAGLAAIVVMCMTRPRTSREWAVALISTVVCSIAGGAAAILHFGLLRLATGVPDFDLYVALVGLLGLVFACGLPGWLIVRAAFRWMDKRRDHDLADLADDVMQDAHRLSDSSKRRRP